MAPEKINVGNDIENKFSQRRQSECAEDSAKKNAEKAEKEANRLLTIKQLEIGTQLMIKLPEIVRDFPEYRELERSSKALEVKIPITRDRAKVITLWDIIVDVIIFETCQYLIENIFKDDPILNNLEEREKYCEALKKVNLALFLKIDKKPDNPYGEELHSLFKGACARDPFTIPWISLVYQRFLQDTVKKIAYKTDNTD